MRITLVRRVVQVCMLGLFCLPPLLAGWGLAGLFAGGDGEVATPAAGVFFGSLSSSSVAGVPLFDPLGAVEAMAASRGLLAASALTGALLIVVVYGLVRGRAFCGWVCPVNLVGEGVDAARRRLGIEVPERTVPRRAKIGVAAAVVLPQDFSVIGVDDSKKLSAKKREELFGLILENALAVGIGMRNNKRIDEINILEATKEAMADAVAEVQRVLGSQLGHILFDAMKIDSINIEQTSLIKGDTKSVSIAAASIIAKVTRDRMMVKYAEEYPDYAFEKNKGYGTKAHYEGISRAGICPIHRKTFLKNIIF